MVLAEDNIEWLWIEQAQLWRNVLKKNLYNKAYVT